MGLWQVISDLNPMRDSFHTKLIYSGNVAENRGYSTKQTTEMDLTLGPNSKKFIASK